MSEINGVPVHRIRTEDAPWIRYVDDQPLRFGSVYLGYCCDCDARMTIHVSAEELECAKFPMGGAIRRELVNAMCAFHYKNGFMSDQVEL